MCKIDQFGRGQGSWNVLRVRVWILLSCVDLWPVGFPSSRAVDVWDLVFGTLIERYGWAFEMCLLFLEVSEFL